MRCTARSANSLPTIRPSLLTQEAGFCCLFVWAALRQVRSLSTTCARSYAKGHQATLRTARTGLSEHSTMELATSLRVGWSCRLVDFPNSYTRINNSEFYQCFLKLIFFKHNFGFGLHSIRRPNHLHIVLKNSMIPV